ncbi:hypothetical protein Tco_0133936 [Tanacetum coccineum]
MPLAELKIHRENQSIPSRPGNWVRWYEKKVYEGVGYAGVYEYAYHHETGAVALYSPLPLVWQLCPYNNSYHEEQFNVFTFVGIVHGRGGINVSCSFMSDDRCAARCRVYSFGKELLCDLVNEES